MQQLLDAPRSESIGSLSAKLSPLAKRNVQRLQPALKELLMSGGVCWNTGFSSTRWPPTTPIKSILYKLFAGCARIISRLGYEGPFLSKNRVFW